jgi:hypothetical protein
MTKKEREEFKNFVDSIDIKKLADVTTDLSHCVFPFYRAEKDGKCPACNFISEGKVIIDEEQLRYAKEVLVHLELFLMDMQ